MEAQSHRINRFSIRLNSADQQAALRYRKQLADNWPDLLPVLEAAFERLDAGGDWLHIDKIELHLGNVPADELVAKLPALLQQAIGEHFQKHFFSELSPKEKISISERVNAPPVTENAEQYLRQEPLLLFLFYLETGRLPWFLLENEQALNTLSANISGQLSEIADYLRHHEQPLYYFRALRALTEPQAGVIIRHLVGNDAISDHRERELLFTIIALLRQSIAPVDRSLRLTASLLTFLSRPTTITPAAPVLSAAERLTAEEWRQLRKKLPDDSGHPPPSFFWLKFLLKDDIEDVRPYRSGKGDSSLPPGHRVSEAAGSAEQTLLRQRLDRLIEQNEVIDVHTVPFAGLVLMHAYLPRFFKALDIDPASFSGQGDAVRHAASLLNFIASGEDNPLEPQLELVKILLGLPLDQPLAIAPGLLSQVDKEEAAQLLRALIMHWPALKNTSVAGLRQAFLRRQGYLKKTEDGWSLTVERKGYDVLLDAFPFSFSMVKLKWMPEPIQVNW